MRKINQEAFDTRRLPCKFLFPNADYEYASLNDVYVYQGTSVLRNKLGIRQQEILSDLERQITETKILMLGRGDSAIPKGNIDLRHFH